MFLRKLVGFLLIITAAAGILFCIFGLIQIWRYRPVITRSATDNLALMNQAITTTQEGLGMVSQVVTTTADDVTSLQTTIQSLAQAIHDTSPMLDSLIGLTKNDFPTAISATKTSLDAAQSSAKIIDNVLAALTRFTPTLYQPKVPLHTALAEVSASLDSLPTSLSTIQTSLTAGKSSLNALETEIIDISKTTEMISTTLGSAQSIIDQYITVTNQFKTQVEAGQRSARTWITTIALILSFMLAWLLIVQLGVGMQGLDMVRVRREVSKPAADPDPKENGQQ
jgi:septal ring factor EnvC (AmiA/AmiB activator)